MTPNNFLRLLDREQAKVECFWFAIFTALFALASVALMALAWFAETWPRVGIDVALAVILFCVAHASAIEFWVVWRELKAGK